MDYFENIQDQFKKVSQDISSMLSKSDWLNTTVAIYLMWIVGHYVASNLYAYHCTHGSIYGFVISPLMTATPYCRGILWVITKGSDTITSGWFIMGTAVSALVIKYLPNVSSLKNEERIEKVD